MIRILTEFLDAVIPPVFAQRPPGFAPWFFEYWKKLETPIERWRYSRALAGDLTLAEVDVRGRVTLDVGSGFGLTVLGLARLGAARSIGVEAFAPMIATAQALRGGYAPGLPAHFARGSAHALPVGDAEIDFIYCNEALSHFLSPSAFLTEAARVLRPGGLLMICDGNNAMNRRTVAHVREVWKRFEEGPPGEDVHGHRIEVPYRERRMAMIAQALPGLGPDVLQKLAWGTFGRHGADVAGHARKLLAAGRLPQEPPAVEHSPVDPDKGDLIENLIHPQELAADLRRLGFAVRIHAHFGGARGRWVAAANRILRGLTPLTLPYARSIKVVARREPPP